MQRWETREGCTIFAVSFRVFAVEQFGILRWKANRKTNLLMVLKLKYDTHIPSNQEICLNDPNREEKACVCSVQCTVRTQ